MVSQSIQNIVYVIAAVLFILGLKGMAHPRTAVGGNLKGALGMLIAVVITLLNSGLEYQYILIGFAIGAVIGAIAAIRVAMTAMPEMVAIFNGFGGAASVVVAAAELVKVTKMGAHNPDPQMAVATVLAGLIGSVTFFGSYVAFGKLAEFLAVKWKLYPWQKIIKFGFVVFTIALGVYTAYNFGFGSVVSILTIVFYALAALFTLAKRAVFPGMQAFKAIAAVMALLVGILVITDLLGANTFFAPGQTLELYWLLIAVAALLGVLLTFSIGGADMPVVIALLNSYSGIAAAMTGFVISNTVLIISGSLVGASGIILTNIMCKAMNRSLSNVLFGAMGSTVAEADDSIYANVKATSGDEIAMMLETAQKVLIVPGYGMAVSQAQHAVRDLANLIEEKFDAEVVYGVHPVAGRMPGHMNVLLAEANVPYDKLLEMDEINQMMDEIDLAIVIGANDVVNPVARTDPDSPIAGMPIIDVDKAGTVIVIKRSLSPGFAGIPNPLFALDNSLMFFNDGKKAFNEIIEAVKEV